MIKLFVKFLRWVATLVGCILLRFGIEDEEIFEFVYDAFYGSKK